MKSVMTRFAVMVSLQAGASVAFGAGFSMVEWRPVQSAEPSHIEVLQYGPKDAERWIVMADLAKVRLEARMAYPDRRARTSVQGSDCKVAVNAGYFNLNTSKSASIYVQNGELLGIDERNINRGNGLIGNPARAVLGLSNGEWTMRWARSNDGLVYSFSAPTNPWEVPTRGELWNLGNGVGGGPMLVVEGDNQITSEAELFDSSSGVDPNGKHARTAVGLDDRGRLYILVVDGRRGPVSGANMRDLSDTLIGFGATSAMNFDGGGSATLVVGGSVINHPSDGLERAVSTILCLKE